MNDTTTKRPRVMLQPPKDEIRRQLEVAIAEKKVLEKEQASWLIRALCAGFVIGFLIGWLLVP